MLTPLHPVALASVPYGIVLIRVRKGCFCFACQVLALSFRVSFLLRRHGNFHPIKAPVRDARWCDESPRSVSYFSYPPYYYIPVWINTPAPPVDGATLACALADGQETPVNQGDLTPPYSSSARLMFSDDAQCT